MKILISILVSLLFLFCFNCTFFLNYAKDVYILYDIYDYYSDYGFDYSSINVKVSEFDFVFVGKPTRVLETVKINIHGFDEVYSLYEVNVTNQLKGSISTRNINILYYGGIYDGTLYISDPNMKNNNDKVPEINKYYMFSCNNYKEFKPDSLNYKDIFYIENPYSMIYLENFTRVLPNLNSIYRQHYEVINKGAGVSESYDLDSIQTTALIDLEGPGDDESDGGESDLGTSFLYPINIHIGQSITSHLSSGEYKYYRFSLDNYELINIQSSIYVQPYNVTARLFNKNFVLIDVFDNHTGLTFSSENILNKEDYYLVISSDEIDGGSVAFSISNAENCFCFNDPNTLLQNLNYDAVTSDRVLSISDYPSYNRTSYYSELLDAINNWDALGYVELHFTDDTTSSQVKVYDINESDSEAIAKFTPFTNTIYFNTYYMDSWTYDQRLKTITHELGHALGFNEFNDIWYNPLDINELNINVMVQGLHTYVELGPCDKLVYYYKWRDDL